MTTIRLPLALHQELADAAKRAGHSMTEEIIWRCTRVTGGKVTLRDIAEQNKTTQSMVQQIIDAISPRR